MLSQCAVKRTLASCLSFDELGNEAGKGNDEVAHQSGPRNTNIQLTVDDYIVERQQPHVLSAEEDHSAVREGRIPQDGEGALSVTCNRGGHRHHRCVLGVVGGLMFIQPRGNKIARTSDNTGFKFEDTHQHRAPPDNK